MSRTTEMRALFARWKESGLSLLAFGKQEGVSYSKLLYWRKKLDSESVSPSRADLIPVEIVADAPPRQTAPSKFEVWLANGMSLEVQAGFDAAELRRLVGVLQSC